MQAGYRSIIISFLILVSVIWIAGCGTNESASVELPSESSELIEVKMSAYNFNEYFDFVEATDGEWIAINKKYDEGMVVWEDSSLDIATGARFDEDGDHRMVSNIFSTIFSEKPEITDVRGSMMFAKNGKKYIDDKGWLVIECGNQTSHNEISGHCRADYLEQYPY